MSASTARRLGETSRDQRQVAGNWAGSPRGTRRAEPGRSQTAPGGLEPMSTVSRRNFLGTAAVTTAAAVSAALPGARASTDPGRNAAPAAPSHHLHGDIRDIKHVVVVMQENRSFDHYFGSLK